MIKVDNLTKKFGGFTAVNEASLEIATGSITGLIGPNGAGKTTLFNVIAGVHKPSSGQVLLDGEDITALPPHTLFEKGMLRTFQIAHEFSSLSVHENLMMVPDKQPGESLVDVWLHGRKVKQMEEAVRAKGDPVIVMAEGSVLAEGTLAQIKANEQVIEAYLGTGLKNKAAS